MVGPRSRINSRSGKHLPNLPLIVRGDEMNVLKDISTSKVFKLFFIQMRTIPQVIKSQIGLTASMGL